VCVDGGETTRLCFLETCGEAGGQRNGISQLGDVLVLWKDAVTFPFCLLSRAKEPSRSDKQSGSAASSPGTAIPKGAGTRQTHRGANPLLLNLTRGLLRLCSFWPRRSRSHHCSFCSTILVLASGTSLTGSRCCGGSLATFKRRLPLS